MNRRPLTVIGLGNPGAAYAQTRHNAGFWLLDAVAASAASAAVVGQFSPKSKFHGAVAVADGVRLLKPQTYMNNSGIAVAAVAAFYAIPHEALLVAHDEVDLPAGVVKLKFGGGNAGHNGLADINRCLGGGNYWRLRIGVGKPAVGGVERYVLQAPCAAERSRIDAAIARVVALWDDIRTGNYEAVMLRLHSDNATADGGSA